MTENKKVLTRRNALRGIAAVLGAGAATTAVAAPASAAWVDWRSTCRNIPWSKKDVIVATRTAGNGWRIRLSPGEKTWYDIDSVLIQYTRGSGYITTINGREIKYKGWHNTLSYFGEIEVAVVFDPDMV